MSANTTEEFARVLHKFGEGCGLTSIERAVIISGVLDLTAQRDRALEAVEKLREAGSSLRPHIDYDRWPNECDTWDAALAATEPATVELPKCDHCGASCGTDCDGSSHYTPEKKEAESFRCSGCHKTFTLEKPHKVILVSGIMDEGPYCGECAETLQASEDRIL